MINTKMEDMPNYEEIFDGNVLKKVKIARKFLENIKMREKLKS